MKIVISSGHGKYIRGAEGLIDEVDEARRVVDQVAEILITAGVPTVVFHDNTSDDQDENLKRIVDYHNDQIRDRDVSVHFNAYLDEGETTPDPKGTEVWYKTQNALAAEVSDSIAAHSGLKNRGAKPTDNLYFLNETDEAAILIEVCFVDSQADCDIYRGRFEDICFAIAESISGETISGNPDRPEKPERPPEGPDHPPTAPEARRTLEEGDEGEDVAEVQRILGIPDDGDFGPATDSWVAAFQAACGLDDDGVVGPNTWEELDDLDTRMEQGLDGISEELAVKINTLVERSGLANYEWDDRGEPPPGYIAGMAKTYALAVTLYQTGNQPIWIMGKAETGDSDDDALTWYHKKFADKGMKNDKDGIDTLRHLFVMMIGLGMRESSGNHWEGRDMSADNVEADTCEAGLFQTSWNINTCSDTIPRLLNEYWEDPNGFQPTFTHGLYPNASQLDCYGTGDGARYQFLARFSPAFHVLVTGVGMRLRGGEEGHWGPIRRGEVDIVKEFDDLLMDVERLMDIEV
jgi:peptidoglycan hydrolase-like protein with peptidoglycan-binding domain